MYATITNSEDIFHSPHYAKLKKLNKSLISDRASLSKKVEYTGKLISTLEYNISSLDQDIEDELAEKKIVDAKVKELEFQSQNLMSKIDSTSNKDEQKNLAINLEKLKLDYLANKDVQKSHEQIIDLYSSELENVYEHKRDEERFSLVLKYSQIALENLLTRVSFYLKKESFPSRVKSILVSKKSLSNIHNLEAKMMDTEKKQISSYNLAMNNSPSEAEITRGLSSKKRTLPRIKL